MLPGAELPFNIKEVSGEEEHLSQGHELRYLRGLRISWRREGNSMEQYGVTEVVVY